MGNENQDRRIAFIQTEIDLGFTFLETAKLAGSQEHREQAIQNAEKAYATADGLLGQLPAEQANPSWRLRLSDLEAAIDLLSTRL